MDWLRRNWPDLLIGVALVAVIGGIVATLLTGGSFFQNASPTPNPVSADGSVTLTTPDATQPNANAVRDDEDEADGNAPTIVAPLDPNQERSDTATPPGAPSTALDGDDTDDLPTPGPDLAGESANGTAAAATQPPDATIAPLDLPPAGTSSAPYRVSVGAFGARENAATYAQRFRDDGFPVFLGVQGNLTIVLVGPYDTQADADRVASVIRAGDYDTDPLVYLFQPDEPDEPNAASGEDAEAAPPSPPAPATERASPTTTANPANDATATSGVARSMQVGAFVDAVNAEPLIADLERLGFAPNTLREDGLFKVVVGPFQGSALDDARTILDGAGIAYFNR